MSVSPTTPASRGTTEADEAFHCITCSDEGCELVVLKLDEARGLALCEAADGAHSTVETGLLDGVQVGDTLLVHAGTALTKVAA